MKNKAPLALMEQIIMLLVLAVAAVVCLQAFLWADRQADLNSRRDYALQQMQYTAEALKATEGDLHAAAQIVGGYLKNGVWLQDCQGCQIKVIPQESRSDLLGIASITAEADGDTLGMLTVYWQEVAP